MSEDHGRTGSLTPLIDGRAREHEGRAFLEEAATGRVLTFAHLDELIRRRAAELAAAHVPNRARVLIDVADPINFSIEYLGVVAAGRCAVPVNPAAPDAAPSSRPRRYNHPGPVWHPGPVRLARRARGLGAAADLRVHRRAQGRRADRPAADPRGRGSGPAQPAHLR